MTQRFVALIPVREGSQRVKAKNFRKFSSYENLLQLKIRQLKRCSQIDEIYVSSDSKRAEDTALAEGVKFLYRDPYMCGNEARLYEYNTYMLQTIPEENPVVMWTLVTSPLYHRYDEAISVYKTMDPSYDSLVAVYPYHEFLINEHGRPINCAFGHWHLLTQELPKAFQITNGLYMAPKQRQIEWKYWFGLKAYLHQISKLECIDIDYEQDFVMAEALLDMQGIQF